MTRKEIGTLVEALGAIGTAIGRAKPDEKLELYRQLGLELTYEHTTRTAVAETSPRPPVGLLVVSEGGIDQYANLFRHRKLLVIGSDATTMPLGRPSVGP